MRAWMDGETARLDGRDKGAVLIDRVGEDYQLRMTKTEGGEFVTNLYVMACTSLGKRVADAFWMVSNSTHQPLSDWQRQLVRRAFA